MWVGGCTFSCYFSRGHAAAQRAWQPPCKVRGEPRASREGSGDAQLDRAVEVGKRGGSTYNLRSQIVRKPLSQKYTVRHMGRYGEGGREGPR